ncbi:ankyrin repeat-containing domain protein [Thelonectria olida]|uniref:Ankyrin repeat-containing domain protein n=1 Tax=Thelonectria olida TaxID=1576542 RepID=A0A9P8WF35_9HYPO|nr:ankyrin repeat-containing domain protein [Thelonectria olida]
MDGFSVISLTALGSTIANRALSSAEELNELIATLGSHHGSISHLSTFSSLLHKLHQHVVQLETALNGASVISLRLQTDLSQCLGSCDGIMAVLNKQVMRLQPENVAQLDETFLAVQGHTLEAYCQLFDFFVKLLSMLDKDAQDQLLDATESAAVREQVHLSSQTASQTGDILSGGEPKSLASSSKGPLPGHGMEPPPYDSAGSSSSPPVAGPSSSSSGFAKGMSSLTHSLKAMTANLWSKPDPLATAFCQAALRGDIQQMSGFLAQGANINGRNGEGNTPLGCAILANKDEAVQFLLAAGADKTSNSSKLPPLFLAASVGSVKVVQLLISQGADVHQKSWTGQAYFVDVVESGNMEGIQMLLTYGASANTKNLSGRPILAQTVKKGNIDLTKLLLQHGADPNSNDISGNPMLAIAASNDNVEMVRLLLSYGAVASARLLTGNTALVDAINRRRIEIATLLLDHGADANAKDLFGNPIIVAIVKDSKLPIPDKAAISRLLLSHGANPNVADAAWSIYAICYAMETGSTELVKLLLSHGATTDKKMHTGETLLLYALDNGKIDQAKALVEHGADPNAADKKGRTPLMQAISKGNVPLIKMLRTHGADVNLGGCVSPSDLASVMKNPEIFKALGIKVKAPSRAAEDRAAQEAEAAEAEAAAESSRSGRPQSPPPGYQA